MGDFCTNMSHFLPSKKHGQDQNCGAGRFSFLGQFSYLSKKQESNFPIVTQSRATLPKNVSVGRHKSQQEVLGGNIKKLTVLLTFSQHFNSFMISDESRKKHFNMRF